MHIYFALRKKKEGRVIKKFSIDGHKYDGEGQIGEKMLTKIMFTYFFAS